MSTITQSTLSNGVTLVTEHDPTRASVALNWLVPTGVVRDPVEQVGMSAVVEELLMRGSTTLDSRTQSDAFDTLGCSRGTEAMTFYHAITLTTLSATFDRALPLLVDMVLHPRMDADAVDASKLICTQSVRGLEDDPQSRLRQEFRAVHAPAPADRSPYGTVDGIAAIQPDSPADWWNRHASPDGSIIAAAGGIAHEDLENALEEQLSDWNTASQNFELRDPPAPDLHHVEQDTNQSHIALSFPGPLESDPVSPMERLAVAVLSGGMAGRLFTNLRERRSLCYSVHASYGSNAHFGRTTAYIGTQPERAQEAYECLVAEVESIHTHERQVTEDEFDRAKIGLLSRLVMSGESTRARAASLARDIQLFGRGRTLDERRAAYDALTLDDLREYLADNPRPAHTAMVIGPKPLEALA